MGGGLFSGGGSGLSGTYGNALDAQAGQTGIFSGMPGSNGADLSGGAGGFDYQKFAQNELKNLSQNYAQQAQQQGHSASPGSGLAAPQTYVSQFQPTRVYPAFTGGAQTSNPLQQQMIAQRLFGYGQ